MHKPPYVDENAIPLWRKAVFTVVVWTAVNVPGVVLCWWFWRAGR